MSRIKVLLAVYGGLTDENEHRAEAADVTAATQEAIDTRYAIVQVNNENMGIDPSPGTLKQFACAIERDNETFFYACQEKQTIDFKHGGRPA